VVLGLRIFEAEEREVMEIYHVFLCGDDIGEIDAFFDLNRATLKLKLITHWSCDDAHYRAEYMRGLFKHCGVDVKPLPARLKQLATQLVREQGGY